MNLQHRRRAALLVCFVLGAAAVPTAAQEDAGRLWIDLQSALPRKATGKGKDFLRGSPGAVAPVDWTGVTEAVGVVLGRSQGTPVEPYAMYYLASFQFNAGQAEEAASLFQAIKEQFPTHPLCAVKLALNGRSHVEAALEDCRREAEFLQRFPRPKPKDPIASADRRVTISFPKGDVVIALYDNVAPQTTAQFRKHVSEGLYTGTIVGRIQPDQSIQMGFKESERGRIVQSDVSKGTPPPIPFELSKASHKRGTVSMMRNLGQPESHGVLFEVILKDQPDLDFTRTVFGEIVQGLELLDDVSRQTRDQYEYPAANIQIRSATVAK
jgi:cyclophilin family peptidyl-prolyl cis-trans isomerase